ncbi:MAG: peptidoglycan DD-metalloendopeptidase family protein [Candidatus Micrarchaeota archaeon]
MELSDYKTGILVFVTILILLAVLQPSLDYQTTPTSEPKGIEANRSIENQNVTVTRQFLAKGDRIYFENNEQKPVSFGVIDAVSSSIPSSNVQFKETAETVSPDGTATPVDVDEVVGERFFESPPVYSTITLYPSVLFSRETTVKTTPLFSLPPKPLHILTPPDLSDEYWSTIKPSLSRIADVAQGLTQEEIMILEEKVSEGIILAVKQGNTAEELAQALNQYADEIESLKKETPSPSTTPSPEASPSASETAQATSSPPPFVPPGIQFPEIPFLTPKTPQAPLAERLRQKSMQLPKPGTQLPFQPEQPSQPGVQQPESAQGASLSLPKLPQQIIFRVSEIKPWDERTYFLRTDVDYGQMLLRKSGKIDAYVTVSAKKTEGGYEIQANAYVNGELDSGRIPFDTIDGVLYAAFTESVTQTIQVPMRIFVKHESVAEFVKYLEKTDVETVDEEVPVSEELVKSYYESKGEDYTPPGAEEAAEGQVGEGEGVTQPTPQPAIIPPKTPPSIPEIKPPVQPEQPSGFEGASSSSIICPVVGGQIGKRDYGKHVHPIYHKNMMHWGVDIGAGEGSELVSPANGKVITAIYSGGCGNKLEIDLGFINGQRVVSKFCHLSSFKAKIGQPVKQGEVVGYAGSTGTATGPHLHWETRVNGENVNPRSVTKACG